MTDAVRFQSKCLALTSEYASSFWGKYIWLYQAKGSLALTHDALTFEGGSTRVVVPLDQVTGLGTSRFAWASKPFGLLRLDVRYLDGEDEKTVLLVPYEHETDPSWVTSRVVADWFETLSRVEALSGKAKKLPVATVPEPPAAGAMGGVVFGKILPGIAVFALVVALLLAIG